MNLWYAICEALPLGCFAYDFMKNALLALLLLCPALSALGTVVVNRSMSFFSDSLGHSAMTGVGLGVLLGIAEPTLAMILFGVAFAFGLVWVKSRSAASTDTTIGVFSATAIALGLVLMSKGGGLASFASYLSGDLLSVTWGDIGGLFWLLVAVAVFCTVFYNKLALMGVNEPLARTRGVHTRWIEYLFAAVVAVAVMVSIRFVGVLLINALLVLPAAAARNVARSMRGYVWLAVGFSLLAGVAGLLLSFALDTATGATVVLAAAVCYFFTLPFAKR